MTIWRSHFLVSVFLVIAGLALAVVFGFNATDTHPAFTIGVTHDSATPSGGTSVAMVIIGWLVIELVLFQLVALPVLAIVSRNTSRIDVALSIAYLPAVAVMYGAFIAYSPHLG